MEPIIGEIRAFATAVRPRPWLVCAGQEYPIQGYQALYAVIGNRFGGTPGQTFRVPNLNERAAIGIGTGDGLTPYPTTGMEIGTSEITIGIENMPSHRHRVLVDYGSLSRDQMHAVPAAGDVLLGSTEKRRFARDLGRNREKSTRMAADALAPAGEGAALDNRQPFLALRFYICHQGEYPAPW